MWEYKRNNIEYSHPSQLEDILNELGKDGWEIIYYQEERSKKFGDPHKTFILFKRNIRQKSDG